MSYGYELRGGGQAVTIAADPRFRFKDFQVLMAEVDRAVEGLREGVPRVVAQISRDLAR